LVICVEQGADLHMAQLMPLPEPALVSAGPWQGLDATASAERETIRGSVAETAAGIQGHSPRWMVRGLCRAGLGMGEVGFCWTN